MRSDVHRGGRHVLYLAVLPFYRTDMLRILRDADPELVAYAGRRHIDATVTTGVPPELYRRVWNIRIAGRLILQVGGWIQAVCAQATVVDLNPRSITAWALLIVRRVLGRRTLVWGHLYPRAGAGARTSGVRRRMRMLASGTVLYTYQSARDAKAELPLQPVWVAPNALYRRDEIVPGDADAEVSRDRVLYVGRLEGAKKVDLLVRAFADERIRRRGLILELIGSGACQGELSAIALDLGIADSVRVRGPLTDVSDLRAAYSHAICAVSPGYAGLSVTQSLGFGVPIVVSRDEPHAPEIGLAELGGVRFFETDDARSLAQAICDAADNVAELPLRGVSAAVGSSYSAEMMSEGLHDALRDLGAEYEGDG